MDLVPRGVDVKKIMSTRMILEIAQEIEPLDVILDKYDVSVEELAVIQNDAQFISALSEMRQFWHSDLNTLERIRLKASVMTEDFLEVLADIANDPAQPAPARLQAITLASKLGGAGDKSDNGSAQNITINIEV
jgi:uncharacterized protein (UPF0147 family)